MIALTAALAASLQQPSNCADGQTPDMVVTALYQLVSVPAGGAWDWERIERLVAGEGLFVSVLPQGGRTTVAGSNLATLRSRTMAAFAATGFTEREYRRQTRIYGDFASIYSSFSMAVPGRSPDPLARGLNHFQLVRNEGCWRIVANISKMEGGNWRLPADLAPEEGDR